MKLRLFMEGTGFANRAAFEAFRAVGLAADALLPGRRAQRRAERDFDARAGIRATGRVPCAALGVHSSGSARYAWHYAGADPRDVAAALTVLPPGFASGATFLDYGSGKGRALALGALHGFRRVVGVEFSAALHAAALANAERFRNKHPGAAAWELWCDDATAFALPDGALVVHLYNPFRGAVFDAVMRRIAAAASRPEPVFVVYGNPLYEERLKEIVPVSEVARGDRWRVFRAMPA